jgi:hypothetical protein
VLEKKEISQSVTGDVVGVNGLTHIQSWRDIYHLSYISSPVYLNIEGFHNWSSKQEITLHNKQTFSSQRFYVLNMNASFEIKRVY